MKNLITVFVLCLLGTSCYGQSTNNTMPGSPHHGTTTHAAPNPRPGNVNTQNWHQHTMLPGSAIRYGTIAHDINLQFVQFGGKIEKGKLKISLYTNKNVLKRYVVDTFTAKRIEKVSSGFLKNGSFLPESLFIGWLPGFEDVNVHQYITVRTRFHPMPAYGRHTFHRQPPGMRQPGVRFRPPPYDGSPH